MRVEMVAKLELDWLELADLIDVLTAVLRQHSSQQFGLSMQQKATLEQLCNITIKYVPGK